jgi:hypothetical protein
LAAGKKLKGEANNGRLCLFFLSALMMSASALSQMLWRAVSIQCLLHGNVMCHPITGLFLLFFFSINLETLTLALRIVPFFLSSFPGFFCLPPFLPPFRSSFFFVVFLTFIPFRVPLRKHRKGERKICVCARLIYLGTPRKNGEGKEGEGGIAKLALRSSA